jgi:hypothetical protein
MGYSGNVPRVTGHGARKKGACVMDEVGDNQLHKFLREPGGLGWTCDRCHRDGARQLDFGPGSVPELVGE